jgi:hypothetical protein
MDVLLRDLQRQITRRYPAPFVRQALQELAEAGLLISIPRGRYRLTALDRAALKAELDRLAMRFGGKASLSEVCKQACEMSPQDFYEDFYEEEERDEQPHPVPHTTGEERRKQTSEVRPATSQTTNLFHGGDGASGEVPDGRSSCGNRSRQPDSAPLIPPEEQPKGKAGDQANSQSAGSVEGPQMGDSPAGQHGMPMLPANPEVAAVETGRKATPQGEQGERGRTLPSSPADGQETDQEAVPATTDDESRHIKAASDPGQDAAAPDQPIAPLGNDKAIAPKTVGEDEGTSEIPPSPRAAWHRLNRAARQASQKGHPFFGGMTATLARHHITGAVVRDIRALLESWLSTDGAQDEQSPRYDYAELAARLLTRRHPAPARKRELGRPALLVLADVSGSCAGFSHQALLVAQAIGKAGMPGADIIVISHSNGYPLEGEINGRAFPLREQQERVSHVLGQQEAFIPLYLSLIEHYQISHVIDFGDHDAVDLYEMLARHASIQQVFWLDNYACQKIDPKPARPGVAHPQAQGKIRYIIGCTDAADFVRGLRLALGL